MGLLLLFGQGFLRILLSLLGLCRLVRLLSGRSLGLLRRSLGLLPLLSSLSCLHRFLRILGRYSLLRSVFLSLLLNLPLLCHERGLLVRCRPNRLLLGLLIRCRPARLLLGLLGRRCPARLLLGLLLGLFRRSLGLFRRSLGLSLLLLSLGLLQCLLGLLCRCSLLRGVFSGRLLSLHLLRSTLLSSELGLLRCEVRRRLRVGRLELRGKQALGLFFGGGSLTLPLGLDLSKDSLIQRAEISLHLSLKSPSFLPPCLHLSSSLLMVLNLLLTPLRLSLKLLHSCAELRNLVPLCDKEPCHKIQPSSEIGGALRIEQDVREGDVALLIYLPRLTSEFRLSLCETVLSCLEIPGRIRYIAV